MRFDLSEHKELTLKLAGMHGKPCSILTHGILEYADSLFETKEGCSMQIEELNRLAAGELKSKFLLCCSSEPWADRLVESRPFGSVEELLSMADTAWYELSPEESKRSLQHHPRIGPLSESEDSRKTWQETKQFVLEEHKGVDAASQNSLTDLVQYNRKYEEKFGFIFLISAKGKSYQELVAALKDRLANDPETEIDNVRREQAKITQGRLLQIVASAPSSVAP